MSTDSDLLIVARNLAIFFLAVFWVATIYWVYKDAKRRIEDPWMVAMATVLGAIPPFLGPIIYMFFRPPEYLEDVRERELEIRAMEQRLARRDLQATARGAVADLSVLRDPGGDAGDDRLRRHLGDTPAQTRRIDCRRAWRWSEP